MTTEEILILVIVFGIIITMKVVIIFHMFRNEKEKSFDKYPYLKKTIEKKYRIVLCTPSGELIKIKPSKWNLLCRKCEVQWNGKLGYYLVKDKYSRYKLNKI